MSTTIVIEIPGLTSIKEAFAQAPARMKTEMAKAYELSSVLVQRVMKIESPIDQGILRGSIDRRVDDNSATIWPRANYAAAVNNGTGLFGPNHARIYPTNGKVLAWQKNGRKFFARSIAGQKPNPFVQRTADQTSDQVVSYFGDAALNAIKGP